MSVPPKIFTLKEVAKHDTPNDLWMAVYNKVYDITDFVQDHPGGAEVMFDCGGIDATGAFEDVAHSDDALYMLEPYYVGDLTTSECQKYDNINNPSSNLKVNPLQSDKILIKQTTVKKKKKRKIKVQPNFILRNITFIILISLALIGCISYFYLQKIKWAYQVQYEY